MPRRTARRLGLGALLLAAAALVPIGYAHPSLALGFGVGRAQVVQPPPSVSGARAHQHVDALAGQIGSRPAGSAAYEQAVQYAADQLRQFGYQPTLQTFPVQTYADNGSQLALVQAGSPGESFEAATLQYAAGGEVEAPLIAAGLGRPADLSGLDLRGKVALVKRGELRFSDKVGNASAAGAVGVLVYNDGSGAVQGSLSEPSSIPAATISDVDGQRLLQLLGDGTLPLTVRLRVDAATEQRTGTNVVADKPGRDPGAGQVVIGAHLDSVPAGPGGNDNGSGSAMVLELAQVLAGRDEPFGLHFALFGAEELGLFGSRHYVDGLSEAERQSTRAMLNLDMVGVGQAWRFGGTDDLVQRALGAADELGARGLPLRGPVAGASDHASFLGAGIPALFIYRVEDPNYHTAGDRPELVEAASLEQAGTIALRVLDSLATDPAPAQ